MILDYIKTITRRIGIISGAKGCAYYNAASNEVTKKVKAFVVNDTCVFSRLVAGSTNALSTMNLTNATLKSGTFISCGDEEFTSFQLASGSVIAYF